MSKVCHSECNFNVMIVIMQMSSDCWWSLYFVKVITALVLFTLTGKPRVHLLREWAAQPTSITSLSIPTSGGSVFLPGSLALVYRKQEFLQDNKQNHVSSVYRFVLAATLYCPNPILIVPISNLSIFLLLKFTKWKEVNTDNRIDTVLVYLRYSKQDI